jgi:tRNA modification GTPase
MSDDTIFALSTGSGRGAVAIVRVSGPKAGAALAGLTGRPLPSAREAALRRFFAPDSAELIDAGLVLWFPGPASATGEDVAEFHLHGGRAVIGALIGALSVLPGLRAAEPGEFTRRAFEAGKIDLTEAEGIADLVAAETEGQRRQAMRQMDGALHRLYEGWRGRLLRLMAHVEATLDFSDQDLPEGLMESVGPILAELENEIGAHLDDGRRGERLRDGFYVAILGAANVGKSSLLNRLAGRDAAIVSARAGTTRDVVEVQMDLTGWPITMADTAGLRDSDDAIEIEGVRRALARAEEADLRVVVIDGALFPTVDRQSLDLLQEKDLLVINKCDLLGRAAPKEEDGRHAYAVSCRTGFGIDLVLDGLVEKIGSLFPLAPEPALTRARHREALSECRDAIARGRSSVGDERLAEEVRLATRQIGRITGRVDIEEMLGIVFSDFCIGK